MESNTPLSSLSCVEPARGTRTGCPQRGAHPEDRKTSQRIEVLQVNLHRSKAAQYALHRATQKHDPLIVLMQEPWTVGSRLAGRIPEAEVHMKKGLERPRACIQTRGLQTWLMGQYSNRDMATVQITGALEGGKPLIVASVYMAAEEPAPPPKLGELTKYCRNNAIPLLVGADANSHHTSWGSSDINDRGEALMEFLTIESLDWANKGNKPTFVTRRRSEVLDLTLTNNFASSLPSQWRVSDEDSLSDHKYIRWSIEHGLVVKETYRSLRKANWNTFREEIRRLAPPERRLDTPEDLDQQTKTVEQVLTDALQVACPLRSKERRGTATWWTPKLEEMKRTSRRLLSAAEKSKSPTKWEIYKAHHKEYNKSIRIAKTSSWRRFTEEMETLPQAARVVKAMKGDDRAQLSSVEKPEGGLTSSPQETLEVMLRHHVPSNPQRERNEPPHPTEWEANLEKKVVTLERMEEALQAFQPYKSPGPDGIPPVALKNIRGTPLMDRYKDIFRASIRLRHIPSTWKKGKGIFLPKPGKESYERTNSFRMITLTSFPLKWLERLILWHLERDVGVYNRMEDRQFGFQRGRSTETALHNLVSRIEDAMESNKYALGVFIDIENAFPTVSGDGIRRALDRLNIPGQIQGWIGEMLRERTIEAQLADAIVSRKTSQGCPQGGILSPLLWNMVLDSLLSTLRAERTFAQAYADDIVGHFTGIDPPTLVDLAQNFLSRAHKWAGENGLKLSKSKTEAVVFTRKRGWNPRKVLHLDGTIIPFRDKAKYLGITIDAKLNFADHIKDRAAKALRVCAQANRLVGKKWGMTPAKARWVYTAMVRPILSYGCVTWVKGILVQRNVKELQKVQRLGCLIMTSARRSAPTAALETMMDVDPIDLHLKGLALKTSIRLQATGHWRTRGTNQAKGPLRTHVDIINGWRKDIPQLGYPKDSMPGEWIPSDNITWVTRTREEASNLGTEDSTTIRCFTDGSKLRSEHTGAGAVIMDPIGPKEILLHLGKEATVFQAEVTAITLAATEITQRGERDQTVELYTDSQAAISALQREWTDSRLIKDCKRELTRLSNLNKVQVIWVPGHTGIEGNEKADEAARKAARETTLGQSPSLPVSMTYLKRCVTNHIGNLVANRWKHLPTCKEAKGAMPSPNWKTTQKLLQRSREEIWMITQMITGHCGLAKHQFTSKQIRDPTCPKCKREPETPTHYMARCPAYKEQRESAFGQNPEDLRTILEKGNIASLAKFLRETNRLKENPKGMVEGS